MHTWTCYRLEARSPFHLGARGVGIEESSVMLHSDTLFSAVCLALRELEPRRLDDLLAAYPRLKDGQLIPGDPPFRLSSAFPYAGDTFLFPRPLLKLEGLDEEVQPKLGKKIKKIQFVSQPVFSGLLRGDPLGKAFTASEDKDPKTRPGQKKPPDFLLQGDRVWVSPEEAVQLAKAGFDGLWIEASQPRVSVDRLTNRSAVYSAGQVRFPQGAGLFFLAELSDPAWQRRLEQALRLLGESGIGGERSSGHGQFRLLEPIPAFELGEPEGQTANAWNSLALYWPAQAEVQARVLEGASYSLINRRGWIGSPDGMNLRRRAVRMLAEGAITRVKPQGALVDVRPLDHPSIQNVPHDVWRYGLAFPVACRVPARKEAGHGS